MQHTHVEEPMPLCRDEEHPACLSVRRCTSMSSTTARRSGTVPEAAASVAASSGAALQHSARAAGAAHSEGQGVHAMVRMLQGHTAAEGSTVGPHPAGRGAAAAAATSREAAAAAVALPEGCPARSPSDCEAARGSVGCSRRWGAGRRAWALGAASRSPHALPSMFPGGGARQTPADGARVGSALGDLRHKRWTVLRLCKEAPR